MEAAFLTTEFLTEWADLLRRVSSGPWRSSGSIVAHEDPDVTSEIAAARTLPDAQHLARCDPRTIGALVAEVLKSRERSLSNWPTLVVANDSRNQKAK
ncbi:MAG TPA: hypothetical protein VGG79_19575 [Roseiarcus sp.]|jgi:hypothetical protein